MIVIQQVEGIRTQRDIVRNCRLGIFGRRFTPTLSEALYPTHQCIRRLHGSQLNWHGQGGLRYRLLVQSLGTQWQRRPHITAATLWHELDAMMIAMLYIAETHRLSVLLI